MKLIKYLKLMILPAILLIVLITGFSLKKNSSMKKMTVIDLEQTEGISAYYYQPAGDKRLWHVINKYRREPYSKYGINNSIYTFTADSVTVINEIATVPER